MIRRNQHLTTQEVMKHFTNYLYVLWKFLGLPEPTEIQYEIADWLENGPNRSIMAAFRGCGKSWITGGFTTYALLKDPRHHKFMFLSGGEDKAIEQSQFIKRIIETFPLCVPLRHPNNYQGRWSNDAFDVAGADIAQAPSVRSKGITGQLVGGRPTDIIADDIETPKNAMTPDMRDKLFRATADFEALLSPGGRVVVLGTPQTEESIYNRLVRERQYSIRYLPVEVPLESEVDNYGGNLSPKILEKVALRQFGKPTDPKRFTGLEISERRARMGNSAYKLQFMLDCTLSDQDRYPLKLRDLIVMDVGAEVAPVGLSWASTVELQQKDLPQIGFSGDRFYRPLFVSKEWDKYKQKVMTIDPSGMGRDQIGWSCGGQLAGRIFVFDFGGIHGGYCDENLQKLAELAKKYECTSVVIEDNFGDGMFSKLLLPVLHRVHPHCGLEPIKVHGQKEKRVIETLEPCMNSHRLVVNYGAIKADCNRALEQEDATWYCGMYQLTRITKERGSCKHDDILEAIAMLVHYFQESLSKDTEKTVDLYKKEMWEKEVKGFMKDAKVFPMESSLYNQMKKDSKHGHSNCRIKPMNAFRGR